MRNRYLKRSGIIEAKFRTLGRHFPMYLASNKIAILTVLNRNTVSRYLFLLRSSIAEFREWQSTFHGEIEVDESYFGAKRVKGKCGRGTGSKTPVFGLLQRGGKVYTDIACLTAQKPR